MDPHRPPSGRREFLKLVGLASLSSIAASARVFAQAAKPSTPATTTPADTSKAAAEAPKPPSDDAKAFASIVQRRYGQHLDADQMKTITEDFDNRIQNGQRLRGTKLTNADEPDVTFHA
jgi:hypothetical protein